MRGLTQCDNESLKYHFNQGLMVLLITQDLEYTHSQNLHSFIKINERTLLRERIERRKPRLGIRIKRNDTMGT